MASKKSVEDFLKQKKWAFVGASENKKKFGNFGYKELKNKEIELTPVNPNLQSLDGEPVYPSLTALPGPVDAAVVAVPPSKTIEVVREASQRGIKHIWLQQGAESKDAILYCQDNGINCIYGECVLMFAEPIGFPHSAHRFIWKLLGKLPK